MFWGSVCENKTGSTVNVNGGYYGKVHQRSFSYVEVMGYISTVGIDDIPSATNMVSRNGRAAKNGALSTGPRNVRQRSTD